jgi:rod shape-determining protein MreC
MSGPGQTAGMPGYGQVSLGARFALLAALSLVLTIIDHKDNHLLRVRQLLGLAVHPLHVVVDLPFSTFKAARSALTDNATLRDDNDRLERELLVAQYQLQDLQSLQRENERLRELLNSFEEEQDYQVRIAEILSVDMAERQRFLINRGAVDGVKVGQPLLDAKGIVGQVVAVYPFYADAMLITDASQSVPVTVARNGLRTFAEGTGDSGLLSLPYLPNSADIEVGDLLVTSGLGGVFPRGRPVAEVIDVDRRPEQGFARVTARPVAALDRDQEVLLVFGAEPAATETTASLPEDAR